jgi:hypothetical protein
MLSFTRSITAFALVASGLLVSNTGCSEIGEAIDCDQMCNQLQDCIDGDLNVRDCAERCEDKVDDNTLADKLDACTDCLDHDPSCKEAVDECPACDEVQVALMR